MSAARTAFLGRLHLLRASLSEPAAQDGAPADVMKNGVASVLRSGLAVLIYATAEDFIRERTCEVLRSFDPAIVTFALLPDKLKKAVTIGALRALNVRVKFQPKVDQVNWTLTNVAPVASANVNLSHLSKFSFAHEGANVGDEDVAAILSAFDIEAPWNCITALSKRIGLGGIPDYKSAFEGVAKRRHSAAHDVATVVPHGDLLDSLSAILGLGITFDLLISEACNRLNAALPHGAGTFDADVSIRFLAPHESMANHVREQIERTTNPQTLRTIRIHPTMAAGRAAAVARARIRRQHFVQLDPSGRPQDWVPW